MIYLNPESLPLACEVSIALCSLTNRGAWRYFLLCSYTGSQGVSSAKKWLGGGGINTIIKIKRCLPPPPALEWTLQRRDEHITLLVSEALSLIPEPHPTTYPSHVPRGWGLGSGPAPLPGTGCIYTNCSAAASWNQTPEKWWALRLPSPIVRQGPSFMWDKKAFRVKSHTVVLWGFPALLRHNRHVTLCKLKVRNMMIWYTVCIYKWKLPRKNEIAVNS